MPKLIIQIPCYNEEQTIGLTLSQLPRSLPGIGRIEWLIIDDGSTDRTIEVAREHGVDHVVRMTRNRGLAKAFMTGLDHCIKLGADIIVNTDADNQYDARDVPTLIAPILNGDFEIVVGERPVLETAHWSITKKLLQKAGSWVVRIASGTDIPDAPSGFRAFTRDAAMRINVFNDYTYTIETIIQAGRKNMAISSVKIRTNPDTRPSRLFKSIPSYVRKSLLTIVRILMTYRPFRFFALPGVALLILGSLPVIRWFLFYMEGKGAGNVQSLLLGALMLGMGGALVVVGLVADLIGINRMLLEELRWRMRELEYRQHHPKPEETTKTDN